MASRQVCDPLSILEEAVQIETGESPDSLRKESLSERRLKIEKAKGFPLRLTKKFPFIGRGSVMGDRILPSEEIDRQFMESLED